jgi:methyl-accepting chemotaxis protein
MFKNLTIGEKIALGFTSVLVLTAIVVTIGVVQIRTVDSGIMDMADVHVPLMSTTSEVDAAATNQNLQVSLYAIHKEETQLEEFEAIDQQVDESLENAKKIINSDEELVGLGWLDKIETIAEEHDGFVQSCRHLIEVVGDTASTDEQVQTAADAIEETYAPFMAKVDEFLATNSEEMGRISGGATAAADSASFWMVTIGIPSVVIGSILAFFIARGVITALKRIIANLTEGAEQVASASGQVSSSSQSLAEGATEQAAGLEETSSSLEEMSSMTKQNADNAQQANALASQARKAADNGAESMTRMNTAIHDIQKSSDETAKIIKVIDEIAFQTNLLALNAAVEAARAGEAGKGFAVVAEEVRNLAMRSAEAAKNTSSMIEESVKNSNNGVDIAGEVGKVLDEIVGSIGKTTDLVGEIAAASQEQAQGIDQVNTAVAQMDKVTQQNAANAEESASASEELSAQAGQMNQIVDELATLVGGTNSTRQLSQHPGHANSSARPSDRVLHQIAAGRPQAAQETRAAKQTIPFDDDMEGFNA